MFLINHPPMKSLHFLLPYQILHGHSLVTYSYRFLDAFVSHIHDPYRNHKFDFRSCLCVFLGYPYNFHGYRCLDPVTRRIFVTIVSDEFSFPFHPSSSTISMQSSFGTRMASTLDVDSTSSSVTILPALTLVLSLVQDSSLGSDLPTKVGQPTAVAWGRALLDPPQTHPIVTRSRDGTLPPYRSIRS